MSFQFQGLTGSNVTISGNVAVAYPEPATRQTHIQYHGSTTAATVTIATVPAGKIWYIGAVGVTGNSASGAAVKITLNGKMILAGLVQASGTDTRPPKNIAFPIPYKLTAGQIIAYTADDVAADYVITGFEVAA